MGPGAKKPPVERSARRAKSRQPRRLARQESTLEIMDRLLMRQVPISVHGRAARVPAAKAIVLQLMQKAMSGNSRAWRALLKYKEFAERQSEKSTELQFVESDYTRAVAKSSSGGDDG
jgi:hypothetical protein